MLILIDYPLGCLTQRLVDIGGVSTMAGLGQITPPPKRSWSKTQVQWSSVALKVALDLHVGCRPAWLLALARRNCCLKQGNRKTRT